MHGMCWCWCWRPLPHAQACPLLPAPRWVLPPGRPGRAARGCSGARGEQRSRLPLAGPWCSQPRMHQAIGLQAVTSLSIIPSPSASFCSSSSEQQQPARPLPPSLRLPPLCRHRAAGPGLVSSAPRQAGTGTGTGAEQSPQGTSCPSEGTGASWLPSGSRRWSEKVRCLVWGCGPPSPAQPSSLPLPAQLGLGGVGAGAVALPNIWIFCAGGDGKGRGGGGLQMRNPDPIRREGKGRGRRELETSTGSGWG